MTQDKSCRIVGFPHLQMYPEIHFFYLRIGIKLIELIHLCFMNKEFQAVNKLGNLIWDFWVILDFRQLTLKKANCLNKVIGKSYLL